MGKSLSGERWAPEIAKVRCRVLGSAWIPLSGETSPRGRAAARISAQASNGTRPEPRDADCPLVCLDETLKQLIAETRVPISMKAGRPARFDYEYERNGTANLFMMFAPLEGWRHVKVTDRHTAVDYARVLKD